MTSNEKMWDLVKNHGWTITPMPTKCNHISVSRDMKNQPLIRKARTLRVISWWVDQNKDIPTLCKWLGISMDYQIDKIQSEWVDHNTKLEYKG